MNKYVEFMNHHSGFLNQSVNEAEAGTKVLASVLNMPMVDMRN